MAVSLKHAFTSAIADTGDVTLVQPSNWNAEHALTLAAGNLLGRATGAGAGAVTEIPIGVDAAGHITIPAGTASAAPLTLTSGTNLTSAASGSLEYDGKAAYFTPQGTQRGVVPGEQFFRLDSAFVGQNINTVQSVFGVGCTLSSSTVYMFQLYFALYKTAGTTSHQVNVTLGGTATLNNLQVNGTIISAGVTWPVGTSAALTAVDTNSLNDTTLTGANTTATRENIFNMVGTISINAGGTIIPQYRLSAAPGGAYSTQPGSFMRIYPIGTAGANINVGTWA